MSRFTMRPCPCGCGLSFMPVVQPCGCVHAQDHEGDDGYPLEFCKDCGNSYERLVAWRERREPEIEK